MTVAHLYPDINPSLLLDFANVKGLDPRITFTRASGATYYDVDGLLRTAVNNQARFDHDPVTGESLGLLIEEQRTNLVLRSEQFDDVYWAKINSSITVNTAVAPDGTLTADKLVENTATGNHLFFVGSVSSTATVFTASIYAKASERDRLRLQARNELSPSGGANADFNLTTQTVTIVNFGDGTGVGQIESVGNGWFRCSITVTVVTAGTTLVFAVFLANAAGSVNYTGDGTSGILLWGAQLEAGAFPTSYIKTEASQVTRSADSASMTGTNFSSWYRQDEGTLLAHAKINHVGRGAFANGIAPIALIRGTAGLRGISLDGVVDSTPSQLRFTSRNDSSLTSINTGSYVPGVYFKVVGSYDKNNLEKQATQNGNTPVSPITLNALSLPEVQLFIGNEAISGTAATSMRLNGHIKSLYYYPRRLINTQLQALTNQ